MRVPADWPQHQDEALGGHPPRRRRVPRAWRVWLGAAAREATGDRPTAFGNHGRKPACQLRAGHFRPIQPRQTIISGGKRCSMSSAFAECILHALTPVSFYVHAFMFVVTCLHSRAVNLSMKLCRVPRRLAGDGGGGHAGGCQVGLPRRISI